MNSHRYNGPIPTNNEDVPPEAENMQLLEIDCSFKNKYLGSTLDAILFAQPGAAHAPVFSPSGAVPSPSARCRLLH